MSNAQDDRGGALSVDDIGDGKDIAKLLAFAREPGKTREQIVSTWNAWIAQERKRDSKFKLELFGLNASSSVWKATPLWGKAAANSANLDRLQLSKIDWIGADLKFARLQGAYLWGAHLEDADLRYSHFEGSILGDARLDRAWFQDSHMEGALFSGASLGGADLRSANFTGASGLEGRDWRNRDLTGTIFADCDLSAGNFSGAILRKADFDRADVSNITYRTNLMLGRYLGIRGVDASFGDPGWRRDALDQDFIDDRYSDARFLVPGGVGAVRKSDSKLWGWFLNSPPGRLLRAIRWSDLPVGRRLWFWLWSFSDYGRSVSRVGLFAILMIALFGLGYSDGNGVHISFTHKGPTVPDWLYPWFAASMGFATLGITDLIEPLDRVGLLLMIGNVLSGFLTLGMFLSLLGNVFARRS